MGYKWGGDIYKLKLDGWMRREQLNFISRIDGDEKKYTTKYDETTLDFVI